MGCLSVCVVMCDGELGVCCFPCEEECLLFFLVDW